MEKVSYPAVTDIRPEWGWVRPIIERILERSPQFTYLPEDVYTACKSGNAQFWVNDDGFVISAIEVDRFTGEKSFFIWLAGAKEIGGDQALAFDEFFCQVALQSGCTRMETRTSVPEVGDHLSNAGWKKDHVVYSQDLKAIKE